MKYPTIDKRIVNKLKFPLRNHSLIEVNHKFSPTLMFHAIRMINSLIIEHSHYLLLELMRDKKNLDNRLAYYMEDEHIIKLFSISRQLLAYRTELLNIERRSRRTGTQEKDYIEIDIDGLDFYIEIYEGVAHRIRLRTVLEIKKNDLL